MRGEADGAKLNWTGLDCLISPVISGVLSVLATSSDPGFQKGGSEISRRLVSREYW